MVATSFGSHIREQPRGQGAGRQPLAVGRWLWGLSPGEDSPRSPTASPTDAPGGEATARIATVTRTTQKPRCRRWPSTQGWARACGMGCGPCSGPSRPQGSALPPPHHLARSSPRRRWHPPRSTVLRKGSFLRRHILQESRDCPTPRPADRSLCTR